MDTINGLFSPGTAALLPDPGPGPSQADAECLLRVQFGYLEVLF